MHSVPTTPSAPIPPQHGPRPDPHPVQDDMSDDDQHMPQQSQPPSTPPKHPDDDLPDAAVAVGARLTTVKVQRVQKMMICRLHILLDLDRQHLQVYQLE